jgi:hypothetical protein
MHTHDVTIVSTAFSSEIKTEMKPKDVRSIVSVFLACLLWTVPTSFEEEGFAGIAIGTMATQTHKHTQTHLSPHKSTYTYTYTLMEQGKQTIRTNDRHGYHIGMLQGNAHKYHGIKRHYIGMQRLRQRQRQLARIHINSMPYDCGRSCWHDTKCEDGYQQ